jgi:hypothetical protein
VPDTDPTRASSFTAGDDFFANYVSDDFFGFTANEPFMDASGRGLFGKLKNKKGSSQRATQTRCATNLERLGMLYPNVDQYSAEVSKAYAREGSNFNAWASAKSNPCFVVGVEQGGLQSGGTNFTAGDGFFNAGGKSLQEMMAANKRKKIMGVKQKGSKNDIGLNFTAGDNFFNAHGVPIATDEPNFKF